MKIKTKLKINTIVSLIIVFLLGIILLWFSQKVEDSITKDKTAALIVRGIFALNILTNDYLLHRETQVKEQWFLQYDYLSRLIAKAQDQKMEGERFLNKVEQYHASLHKIFSQLVMNNHDRDVESKQKGVILTDREKQLVSQLLMNSQIMVSSAHHLAQKSKHEVITAQRNSIFFIFLLVTVIAIIILATNFLLNKSIAKPIAMLRKGVQLVGGGDLSHKVATMEQDEIGDLSRSFDQMTSNLKVQQDKSRQLNEELQQHKTNLERLVEERTGKLKKANEQLQLEIEDRQHIEKELKDFAYIVSHDLKAPLRGIAQLSDWLAKDYSEVFDEDGTEILRLLILRVTRMDQLIEGVLQYSRVGRHHEQKEQLNLSILVKEIIELLVSPGHIQITIENNLPTITADKTRIEQIFQNLLSNAIKFNDKPEGAINIDYIDEGSFHKFSIADNGPGIDERYHEKIFKIFQTLQSRDETKSTGIGLTTVKKIVEHYNGKIWVESKNGEGTTFFFTLPKKELQIIKEEHAINGENHGKEERENSHG